MKQARVSWIDIARGIGIIFVIYSHVLKNTGYSYLFFAFHMPLFFFLSGVVYRTKDNWGKFFRKSVKGLLLPYFIFALIMFALWAFRILLNGTLVQKSGVLPQFLGIFYGSSSNGYLIFNDALWFLPTLFVVRILFKLASQFSGNGRALFRILFFFSIIGYLFFVFLPQVKLPFGFEIAFSAVVFYGSGYLWNKYERLREYVFKFRYFLFISLLLLGGFLATFNYQLYGQMIDMRFNQLNNYFLFYLSAFSGIFAWISFSMILGKNNWLQAIGKNSMVLFAWHPILFIYLQQITRFLINEKQMGRINIFIPLIYALASVIIIMFLNEIWVKTRKTAVIYLNRSHLFPIKRSGQKMKKD